MITISEDGSEERAEWDQRIYAVTGRRWYNLMDQNVQALRDGVEKVAKQYAAEQVAAALAAPALQAVLEPPELPPLPEPYNWCDPNAKYSKSQMENYARAALASSPVAQQWRGLSDVQWMNIVNHDHAYENFSKDDAVHEAVKRTEAKLRELNAAPSTASPSNMEKP